LTISGPRAATRRAAQPLQLQLRHLPRQHGDAGQQHPM